MEETVNGIDQYQVDRAGLVFSSVLKNVALHCAGLLDQVIQPKRYHGTNSSMGKIIISQDCTDS